MVHREDFINVVCDNCRNKFKEQIARLQETHVFQCLNPECGALVECNLNELDVFVREEAENDLAYLRLHVFKG